MNQFRAPFEWEELSSPVTLLGDTLEQLGSSINDRPKKFEIKRDKDYRLEVTVTGVTENIHKELVNYGTEKGQTIRGDTLVFNSQPFEKYILQNFIPISVNRNGIGEYEIKAHIGSIQLERGIEDHHSFIVHAINCPDIHFPDSTSWGDSGDSTITIGKSQGQSHDGIKYTYPNQGGGMSFNCAFLKNKFGRVILTRFEDDTLKKYGPCSIHFLDKDLSVDETLRNKWIIALSYMIGSRLIPVSESSLSRFGAPRNQKSFSPYLLDDFLKPSMAPCRATEKNGFHQDSAVLSKQIELFIENYEAFNLETVVWNLWFGRSMPQGLNLAGYSASLEALSKAWFDSGNFKGEKNYVDPKKYKELVEPILVQIRAFAKTDSAWSKVEYKVIDANILSAHQKIWALFRDLNLQVAQIEKDVLGSRHKLAHGSNISETDYNFVIKAARAYEVIINRCVLSAIKASGSYIDYSTHGFPERALHEPIGGSDISKKDGE